MARIRATRLPAFGGRTVGPGEALYGVAAPLYDRGSWPDLAQALEQAWRGDGTLLLRFFDAYADRHGDGTYGNEQEAFTAVSCLDEPWPTDPAPGTGKSLKWADMRATLSSLMNRGPSTVGMWMRMNRSVSRTEVIRVVPAGAMHSGSRKYSVGT